MIELRWRVLRGHGNATCSVADCAHSYQQERRAIRRADEVRRSLRPLIVLVSFVLDPASRWKPFWVTGVVMVEYGVATLEATRVASLPADDGPALPPTRTAQEGVG
jgi:hypothetical protein